MKKLPKSKIDNLKGYFEEQIQDDGVGTVDERVAKIIKQTCWLCAVVAVFPLPVADIYFLSFLQFLMALRIGEIYGKKVDREEFIHILKSLGLTAVLGYLAQQTAIGLYRTILPGFGAVTTIFFVYSLTFAIGKVLHKYFDLESKGESISGINFKEIWDDLKAEGESIAKKMNKDDLKREASSIYEAVMGSRKKAG